MQIEIETGLYARLLAQVGNMVDSRIVKNLAKVGTEYPFIVYSLNAGSDQNLNNGGMVDLRYLIKAVSKDAGDNNGADEADRIAAAIYTALHEVRFTTDAPVSVYRCQRITLVDYTETQERVQFHHRGGIYRIRASE